MGVSTSIPKGTRDFGPVEMIRRNYIFDIIRTVFRKYGYLPIETPAMENLTTLLGKYGEEGDKLLFKVLNSGDYLSKSNQHNLENITSGALTQLITKKGLRYDLTVPFARYVVQHRAEITFPFKRFQIQPVWRADNPQKGRYREFYQCDVDVIGSDSLFNEYELIQIINCVFSELGIRNIIKVNNRKILLGIAEILKEDKRFIDITKAIDKLEKIGIEGVNREMEQKGVSENAIDKLQPILFLEGDTNTKLGKLKEILKNSVIGIEGVKEMETLFSYINLASLKSIVELDLTLARGLNYYTGAIIEVKATDHQIGSLCGGGRYDDLTSIFGLKGVSGVGVSFGAERIYDVMQILDLFPGKGEENVDIMFVNFGSNEECYSIKALTKLWKAKGISAGLYPDPIKIKKQMAYANTMNISFVAFAGEDEEKKGVITFKKMVSGDESKVRISNIIGDVRKLMKD